MPIAPPIGVPDIPTHTGFILAEDEAVKAAFSGIQVPQRDPDAALVDVETYFRWPEGERRIKYPFITIDLVGVAADYKRWRGLYNVPENEVLFESDTGNTPGNYIPDITPDPLGWLEDQDARTVLDATVVVGETTLSSATADFTAADVGSSVLIPGKIDTTIESVTNSGEVELADAATASGTTQVLVITPNYPGVVLKPLIPMILTYQVAHHARSALHDRFLMSKFYTDVVMPRPFWIGVDADQTWRRCELIDMTPADASETTETGSKRIFRKIYTMTMEAEIPQAAAYAIQQVLRVHGDVYDIATSQREESDHAYNDDHLVAADNWTVVPE